MFDKIEYKLLFSSCITKDEYKQLIKKYMDEFNIPYITAKQYIYHFKKLQNSNLKIILNINKHFWIHIMKLLKIVIIYLSYNIYIWM